MTSRLTREGEMRCLFAGGRLCNRGVRRPAGESDGLDSNTSFIVLLWPWASHSTPGPKRSHLYRVLTDDTLLPGL